MISFEDLILISYIGVPNTTTKGTMKKIQFRQHFATTFETFDQKTNGFSGLYMSTFSIKYYPIKHYYHIEFALATTFMVIFLGPT